MLLSSLQTIALTMLRDGVAQASQDCIANLDCLAPRVFLESGLLQRNGTLIQFPHLSFQEFFAVSWLGSLSPPRLLTAKIWSSFFSKTSTMQGSEWPCDFSWAT